MSKPNLYIQLSKCVDQKLYVIKARNFSLGVFDVEKGAFHGFREKFDRLYVDDENHWDQGSPYGTAIPIQELDDKCPDEIWNTREGLYNWLLRMEEKYPATTFNTRRGAYETSPEMTARNAEQLVPFPEL